VILSTQKAAISAGFFMIQVPVTFT
jgi:hypothetical protein